MARFEIVMPKLGESIIEATITKWLKKEGEKVGEDDALVEIATDKVDSEIPSPVEGVLIERFFKEGDIVPVGKAIAVIELGGEVKTEAPVEGKQDKPAPAASPAQVKGPEVKAPVTAKEQLNGGTSSRFYSPLVRNIASSENVSLEELEKIPGTGKDNRVTKEDLLNYIKNRAAGPVSKPAPMQAPAQAPPPAMPPPIPGAEDQVVEMDRIRKLIATHMVKSVQTSPHVTSFVEADVTGLVKWRDRMKDEFMEREKMKLTFTPVFIEAIARSIRDNPLVNVSVDGTNIIVHKNINVGMAVALPNYNLIVPVIKNADMKSLAGITREMNDLAERARLGKLVPDEIMGGTISLTNLGSFGTLMGSPIINQPQTAIVATGLVRKRPVVIEGKEGDSIAIRHILIASLTFDHRVIDGALAGHFLNSFVKHLENFDTTQTL